MSERSDAYDYAARRMSEATLAAIDAFWESFRGIAPGIQEALSSGATEEIATLVHGAMDRLPKQLSWEIGGKPNDRGAIDFAITSELSASDHVLSRAIRNRAPDVEGWAFHDARPPVANPDEILRLTESRAFAPFIVERIEFREGAARTIDISGYGHGENSDLAGQAELVFAIAHGEQAERIWLGDFRGESERRALDFFRRKLSRGNGLQTVVNAIEESAALLAELQSRRPDAPFFRRDMSNAQYYTTGRNEDAPPMGDQDVVGRRDTISAGGSAPEIQIASLQSLRFRSERFSQFAETFCYLKLHRGGAPDDSAAPWGAFFSEDPELSPLLASRAALEEALDSRLRDAQLGAVFGGATGAFSSYVDLALVDLETSIPLIADTLRAGNIGRSAWIFFNEDGLEDFFIPIYPDAPSPPFGTRH